METSAQSLAKSDAGLWDNVPQQEGKRHSCATGPSKLRAFLSLCMYASPDASAIGPVLQMLGAQGSHLAAIEEPQSRSALGR